MVASKKITKIPCSFGNVGVGKDSTRLTFRFSRETLALEDADALLTGARLQARVVMSRNAGDGLPGIESAIPQIDATVDCRRIGIGTKDISGGLTFSNDHLELGKLATFSGQEGTMHLKRVGDIQDIKGDDDADAKAEQDEDDKE